LADYLTYEDINVLAEVSFIAKSTYTFKFVIVDQSGSPINITTASCSMLLAPFGTSDAILEKTGNIISTNSFNVVFSETDTADLSGEYTRQPKIKFANGVTIRPGQGNVVILRGIS
jgi:hypothetical protein